MRWFSIFCFLSVSLLVTRFFVDYFTLLEHMMSFPTFQPVLGESESSLYSSFGDFISQGGIFLWLILGCGFAVVFIVAVRMIALRMDRVMPPVLWGALSEFSSSTGTARLEPVRMALHRDSGESPLRTIVEAAFHESRLNHSEEETTKAVEVKARRMVVAMQWGLSALEVIITISPLLGLLGTAAGLVQVFGGISEADKDVGLIALGIGRALSTTIAGLAVAVPAVIAHSAFTRSVEVRASETEVALQSLVSLLHRKPGVDEEAVEVPQAGGARV